MNRTITRDRVGRCHLWKNPSWQAGRQAGRLWGLGLRLAKLWLGCHVPPAAATASTAETWVTMTWTEWWAQGTVRWLGLEAPHTVMCVLCTTQRSAGYNRWSQQDFSGRWVWGLSACACSVCEHLQYKHTKHSRTLARDKENPHGTCGNSGTGAWTVVSALYLKHSSLIVSCKQFSLISKIALLKSLNESKSQVQWSAKCGFLPSCYVNRVHNGHGQSAHLGWAETRQHKQQD